MIANFVAHLQNQLNLKFNNQQSTDWVSQPSLVLPMKYNLFYHLNICKAKLHKETLPIQVKSTLKSLEYDIEDNCYITYGDNI